MPPHRLNRSPCRCENIHRHLAENNAVTTLGGKSMKSKTTIGAFRRKADYKYDYFYKLWEFHENLLWSRVQYFIIIVVGIYMGWFLLFQKFDRWDGV